MITIKLTPQELKALIFIVEEFDLEWIEDMGYENERDLILTTLRNAENK